MEATRPVDDVSVVNEVVPRAYGREPIAIEPIAEARVPHENAREEPQQVQASEPVVSGASVGAQRAGSHTDSYTGLRRSERTVKKPDKLNL